ncbi:MAG: zeta toxin family protein, partial [Syntrophaceae bacterium]|nr:zeta toxin family protein [Syntrophaceae bacterium]
MENRAVKRVHPTAYIISGPNGAGKTTFALEFLPNIVGCHNFINADLIARGLSPLNIEAAAIEAGRLFLRQIRAYISTGSDFGFETTLSGTAHVRLIYDMRRAGYAIRLYYLWLPTVQLALKRIAERVRRGGHHIPPDVVKRRFGRGLANLFHRYLSLVDYCAIFDNSSASPVLVYERTSAS